MEGCDLPSISTRNTDECNGALTYASCMYHTIKGEPPAQACRINAQTCRLDAVGVSAPPECSLEPVAFTWRGPGLQQWVAAKDL
jgi:hypothetical protein